ncbi:MAG: PDZ domain-containing protein [bacterium]|nr:PDZ domain-containing protein [bacterium]
MRIRRSILLIVCAAVVAGAAVAPAGPRRGRISRASLAHSVPARSGVFIELLRLRTSDAQLRRANLWTAVRLVLGEQTGRSAQAFDWRALVRRYLSMTPEAALAELFGYRAALAAPSWNRLSEAVILARLRRRDSLDAVVGPKRANLLREVGPVRVYKTVAGLWVATDGRVAVFSHAGGEESLFAEVVGILGGDDRPVLGTQDAFVEQVGALSQGYVGCLYFAESGEADTSLSRVLPAFGHTAVAMYAREDRLDFELQAKVDPPADGMVEERPTVDLGRLDRLPSTTLAAWATTMDLSAATQRLLAEGGTDLAGRYLSLFRGVVGADVFDTDIVGRLQGRQILVWDRLRGRVDVPQFAVLLESVDAPDVARTLAEGVANLSMAGRDDSDGADIIRHSRHLDADIYSVPLTGLLSPREDDTLVSLLMSSMEPSFAALDGWVLIATNPAQARQMIEADAGWISTLGSPKDLRSERRRLGEDAVVMAVAQPAIASAVVRSWERGDTPDSSRLAKVFGNPHRAVGRARQQMLGIGIKKDEAAGGVVVVRVQAKKPAVGKIEVGDRIVGVDGRLLALDHPVEDLRRRIATCADPARLTLRIWRGDRLMDVVVPMPHTIPTVAKPTRDPLEALRKLQTIGRAMSYAVYSVSSSPPDEFRAQLSLRLVASVPVSRRAARKAMVPAATQPARRPARTKP